VAQLRGEKRDAEAGLQALQVEKEGLHSVVLGLQAEKESVDAVVLELQAEKESMHAAVLELQAEKAGMAAEILTMQLEQGSMKTAIEFQVSEIAQLKADLAQSRREAAHYCDRCAEVQRKVSNLSMELRHTRDGVRELQGGNYLLLIIDLKADVREAQESLVTLSSALDVTKMCCNEYQNQIGKLQESYRQMCQKEEALVKDAMTQRQLLINVLKFNSETIICPITTEPITSPTVLECGHVFESESARGWLNAKGNGARCPICRAPFRIVE